MSAQVEQAVSAWPPSQAGPRRSERLPRPEVRRREALLVLLLLVGVCVPVVAQRQSHHHELSVNDEFEHLDYLNRASHLHLVGDGDTVGPLAMQAAACLRPNLDPDPVAAPPMCHGPYDPGIFANDGYSTVARHPPTYYLLTGVTARLLVDVRAAPSLLVAGRVLGGVWLALGLWLIWLAVVPWSRSRWLVALLLALVATTPAVLRVNAIVSPDATAMLAGAAMLLAVCRWWRGTSGLPALAVAAAACGALNTTDILPVLGVSTALLLTALALPRPGSGDGFLLRERPRRMHVAAAAVAGAAGFAVQGAWLVIAGVIASPGFLSPLALSERVTVLHANQVTGALPALTAIFQGAPPTPTGPYSPHDTLVWATGSLLIAVALAAALGVRGAPGPARQLGAATLVALFLGGPFFVLSTFYSAHAYFDVPTRYGTCLLPLLIGLAAVCLRTRATQLTAGVLAGATAALAVLGLVQSFTP